MKLTGRDDDIALARGSLCKRPRHVARSRHADPVFTDTLQLDLGAVEPAIAGPKRPQDRIALSMSSKAFKEGFKDCPVRVKASRARR